MEQNTLVFRYYYRFASDPDPILYRTLLIRSLLCPGTDLLFFRPPRSGGGGSRVVTEYGSDSITFVTYIAQNSIRFFFYSAVIYLATRNNKLLRHFFNRLLAVEHYTIARAYHRLPSFRLNFPKHRKNAKFLSTLPANRTHESGTTLPPSTQQRGHGDNDDGDTLTNRTGKGRQLAQQNSGNGTTIFRLPKLL